ncbi:hypothetical protein OG741_37785 [Streptomyces sp. NBC_01410]|uniref:Ku protein n=1 Tax=Streptomyces sp. NBC_01410 TaxID=2903856 RepID=UPI0032545EA7
MRCGRGGQCPYAFLVEALARTCRVGIAKFAVRTRERLAVLRPRRGVLVVSARQMPPPVFTCAMRVLSGPGSAKLWGDEPTFSRTRSDEGGGNDRILRFLEHHTG